MCGIGVFVVWGSKEKFSFKFNVTHLMVEGQFINRTHFVLQFGEEGVWGGAVLFGHRQFVI